MPNITTLVDRVKIFATSSGSGPFTLGPGVSAFRGVEALVDGNRYSYAVEQGADFEAGTGVYVLSTQSLVRTPTISSRGGAPVPFTANAQISFTALAADWTYGDAAALRASLAATGGAALVGITGSGSVQSALDAIAASKITARLAAAFTTSSATAVSTGLSVALAPNKTYEIDARFRLKQASAAAVTKLGLLWPTGITYGQGLIESTAGLTLNNTTGATNANLQYEIDNTATFLSGAVDFGANIYHTVRMRFLVVVGASPIGPIQAQIASNGSVVLTVDAGGYMRASEIS